MKVAVWVLFGLIAALWTGSVLLLLELTQWAARTLASGQAVELRRAVAEWPVPEWLGTWLDPSWIVAVQDALARALGLLMAAMPWLGSAVGWLVPLLWTVWALGLLVMLVVAGGAHVMVSRFLLASPRST